MRRAVFMDRDGTLSHEVGYVNHASRFRLFPYTVDAVRLPNRAGLAAVVVTNQAGVARGYFPESVIHEVHTALEAAMAAGDARLDGIYYCPHHPSVGEPPYRLDCDSMTKMWEAYCELDFEPNTDTDQSKAESTAASLRSAMQGAMGPLVDKLPDLLSRAKALKRRRETKDKAAELQAALEEEQERLGSRGARSCASTTPRRCSALLLG